MVDWEPEEMDSSLERIGILLVTFSEESIKSRTALPCLEQSLFALSLNPPPPVLPFQKSKSIYIANLLHSSRGCINNKFCT